MRFADRYDAGRRLAQHIQHLDLVDPVVIGLPRGGVPVAWEVARKINAPLDVIIVRKIGAPSNPEYGIGAIAEGHAGFINTSEMSRLGIGYEQLEQTVQHERSELNRRRKLLRAAHPELNIAGKTVLLIDDGLATGVTATAAARVLRDRNAKQVILAVPVGAPATIREISGEVDQVICLETPEHFRAVGSWYRDFTPTTDEEVLRLLELSGDESRQEGET